MIFLDTNIWISLLALGNPEKEHEKLQMCKASQFIKDNKETIITCKEQQIELINAIQKAKKNQFNKKLKSEGKKGIGSVKEFRQYDEFKDTVSICNNAYEDMCRMADIDNEFTYNVADIIKSLKDSDINDSMYVQYCINKNISFYTFDKELFSLVKEKNEDIVKIL